MKKLTLFLVPLLFLNIISLAQKFDIKNVYPIETSHSYVNFEVTYMGYAKVKGSFGNFYGSIYYNPEDLSQTSISFQIEIESIDTNNDWRDKDLQSDNWFTVEKFPYAHFISKSVKQEGEQLKVEGELTLKETTKVISFEMQKPIAIKDMRGDDQVIFVGEYTLNRKEYGVMGSNWSQVKEGIAALSDEVTIEFSMLGKQINESNFTNFLRNETRPPGSIYAAFKSGGVEEALQQYETLKAESKVNPNALNMVAYMLMKQNKDEDALILMKKNMNDFPDEANVYDSMGELYAKMGKIKKAKELYRKALEMNANNFNAKEILKHLN